MNHWPEESKVELESKEGTRETQISSKIVKLSVNCEVLQKEIDNLEDRLSGILLQASTDIAKEAPLVPVVSGLVPLAETIERLISKIHASAMKIAELNKRCEL